MTAAHRRWRDEESWPPPRLRIALYVVPQLVGWFSPSASASLAREIADARRQHKAIRNSTASPDFPFSIRDTQGSRNRRNPLKTNNGGHFYSRQKRTLKQAFSGDHQVLRATRKNPMVARSYPSSGFLARTWYWAPRGNFASNFSSGRSAFRKRGKTKAKSVRRISKPADFKS